MQMRLLRIMIFLSAVVLNSCNKSNRISGTYVSQSVMLPVFNGCCTSTEILLLNSNYTFDVYHQDDQGDYLTKEFASGNYELKKNILSFKPDSANNHFDYAKVKYTIAGSDNQAKFLMKEGDEPQKFYKIDLKKADSLYIHRYSHTDWNQESLTIKSDGSVHYIKRSQDKNKTPIDIHKHKKLTQKQFQEYLDMLSQSRLFQAKNTSEKYSITFYMTFKEYNMVIHDQNNIDKKLYNFFFETVRNWVK